jgi:hypothetical protein
MNPESSCKKIAILQSNYIPWKGYFDIINSVDEFVIYDDAQYTRRDWRNRNIIKTQHGLKWLTIPVEVKGKYNQKIREAKIANKKWVTNHWDTLKHNYRSAPCFEDFEEPFEKTYRQCIKLNFLSDVNRLFIEVINSILGIKTRITESSEYNFKGDRSGKIISICKQSDASVYLSGPSAKSYLDQKLFSEADIIVEWAKYDGYPEYNQLYPPFSHSVSIIDLIFNQGINSTNFMKSF